MKIWLTVGTFLVLSGCGAAPTLRVMAEGASPDVADTRKSQLKRPPKGEELLLPIDCPGDLGAARVWLGLRSRKIDLKIDCAVPLPTEGDPSTPGSETQTITFDGTLPRRGNGVVESLQCPGRGGFIEVRVTLNKDDYRGAARCATGGQ
jgi:hypothetical protein